MISELSFLRHGYFLHSGLKTGTFGKVFVLS
jgi:hypothetical protein